MSFISRIKEQMRPPTPLELAAEELALAERAILEARSGIEWAQALVTYNEARIDRLKAYIHAA